MNSFNFLKKLFIFILLINLVSLIYAEDSLKIYSPSYFDEQENVYDIIHYLNDEDLSFKFCSEENVGNVKFYLSCDSSIINLDTYDYDSNCYFSNYDLEKLNCTDFTLQITYDSDNKKREITRSFKEESRSNLANLILANNIKSLNSLDLSYYLIILADIRSIDNLEVQDAYDLLKNLRNNKYKCWPAKSCDLSETTTILRNLKLAGFVDESRILEDGEIYLENNIIEAAKGDYDFDSDNYYEFEFKFLNNFTDSGDIECVLYIDDGKGKEYEYEDGDDREDLFLTNDLDEELTLDCEKEFDNIELRIFEDKIAEKDYDNDDYFKYEISDAYSDLYQNFDFVLEIDNDFSSGDEIECVLNIDGERDNLILSKSTKKEELIFKDSFKDKVELDCDEDIDDMFFDVYANLDDETKYSNEDRIDYKISGVNDNAQSYEFRYDLNYNFQDSSDELECDLTVDGGLTRHYIFDNKDELIIKDKQMTEKANLDCNKNVNSIRFRLYNSFGTAQIDEENENIDSFSGSVPGDFEDYSCIGSNGDCDYSVSIQALYLYESDFDRASNIEKYATSLIQDHDLDGVYVDDTNPILDSAKYLVYQEEEDLTDYIKYSQNNEGSWGNSDKILTTFWAALGLENVDSDSEHLEDAKDWVYYEEPENGWGSIENNGLAYTTIKEKLKPYLVLNSENLIYDNTVFNVTNPTIYNLQDVNVKFSSEISDYISGKIDLGNLNSEDSVILNLSVSEGLYGTVSGEMSIEGVNHKKEKVVLVTFPVKVVGKMPFEIDKKNYTITDKDSDLKLKINQMAGYYNLNCSYINPFSNALINLNLISDQKEIVIQNPNFLIGDYSVGLSCNSDLYDFSLNVPLNIVKVNESFSVNTSSLLIDSQDDISFNIVSLSDKEQDVNIVIDGGFNTGVQVSSQDFKLAPNENKQIVLDIVNYDLLTSLGNDGSKIVVTGSNGYSVEIPINLPVEDLKLTTSSTKIWYISIGIILLIILIGFIIRRYRQLNAPQEQVGQNNNEEDMEFDDLEFE